MFQDTIEMLPFPSISCSQLHCYGFFRTTISYFQGSEVNSSYVYSTCKRHSYGRFCTEYRPRSYAPAEHSESKSLRFYSLWPGAHQFCDTYNISWEGTEKGQPSVLFIPFLMGLQLHNPSPLGHGRVP